MTRRPPAVPLLLAALALTAGCGGPDRPLKVSFKEVPSNVLLGSQSSPTPEAPPPPPSTDGLPVVVMPPPNVIPLPPAPFEIAPPGRPFRPPVTAPAEPTCEKADPLQPPAVEAPSSISARPVAAQYVFRNDGSFKVSGADAQEGRFPATSLRTVSDALESGDGTGFLFNVVESLGETTTQTDYTVVTSQPLGSPFAPGLYITRVTTRDSRGQESVFTPTPSLPLGHFPLTRGQSVEARGADPTTQTAMSFVATVTGKTRVDACGEPLDSWVIDLKEGRILSPDTDVEFDATYAIGTQYGGVILREAVAYGGEVRGAGVTRTNTSTISREPTAKPGPQP